VSERLRLFVALELPAGVRAALCAWCDRVAPAGVRRVAVENLHVTLAFLGARPASEAAVVGELLAGVGGAHPLDELATAGALWLPPRRPGVLTVAVPAGARLSALQEAVVAGLVEAIGFEPEARPFRPHVTVGRVPRGARLRAVDLDAPPVFEFRAQALTLYRSRTGPGGARYAPLARVPLA
jgi:2'-5' RNA ligase